MWSISETTPDALLHAGEAQAEHVLPRVNLQESGNLEVSIGSSAVEDAEDQDIGIPLHQQIISLLSANAQHEQDTAMLGNHCNSV